MAHTRGRTAATRPGIAAGASITRHRFTRARALVRRSGELELRAISGLARVILRGSVAAGRVLLGLADTRNALLAFVIPVLFLTMLPAGVAMARTAPSDAPVAVGSPNDYTTELLARLRDVDTPRRATRAKRRRVAAPTTTSIVAPLATTATSLAPPVSIPSPLASRPASVLGKLTVWPHNGALTGWFGEPRGTHRHPGIDIDGETGDAVVAAGEGKVVVAGWAPPGYAGYGMIVIIEHGGFRTLAAHLSRVAVRPGQRVAAGDVVGAVGTTGQVTGSHLHYEVRVNGTPVNPMRYLPAR